MEVAGTLEGLQPYEIHGTQYFRVFYSHADDPDQILECRLPGDAIFAGAKPGQPVTITYLLKTVMAIALRSGQPQPG